MVYWAIIFTSNKYNDLRGTVLGIIIILECTRRARSTEGSGKTADGTPFILRHIISVTKRDSIRSRQIQYGKNKIPIVVMGIPFRSPKWSRMGHRLEPQTGLVLWPLRYSTGKIKIPLLWWGPKTGGMFFFPAPVHPDIARLLPKKVFGPFWSATGQIHFFGHVDFQENLKSCAYLPDRGVPYARDKGNN